MKIISGKYKGRTVTGFNIEGTRPTIDRIKESIFNMLQTDIKNSIFLDLFSGSGNIGIEALSNGSKCAYFVDNNKIAINTINENIKKLNVTDEYYVYSMHYNKALKKFDEKGIKFDIIFLDPPYNSNLLSDVLKKINDFSLLNKDGQIIIEYVDEIIDTSEYKVIKDKKYGNKKILILKKVGV